ncbi:conserved hypothetical protein [Culex quinquefasciatus]|uniref:Uncharacterized protein n=1 Tax=Culex quinquefasciatus TaxID=7176 RepID=B0X549_CULQU|nr:conserved hypothetical protein [Culex quinquefasciatus]|eukprot:XP_001864771.1 conserved hypothetical protein [Culex quinquefasciatus]
MEPAQSVLQLGSPSNIVNIHLQPLPAILSSTHCLCHTFIGEAAEVDKQEVNNSGETIIRELPQNKITALTEHMHND